ncbi:MAG: hypothetical protein AAFU79_16810 [Myxococcota bacterium]
MKSFEAGPATHPGHALRRTLRRHCVLARILSEQRRRGLSVQEDADILQLGYADAIADQLSPLEPADARYLADTRSFVLGPDPVAVRLGGGPIEGGER